MNPKPYPVTAEERKDQDDFLDAIAETPGEGAEPDVPVLNAVPRSHETSDGDDPTHPVHDMDADQLLPEDVEDEIAEEGRAELTPERIENGQMGTNRRTPADDI